MTQLCVRRGLRRVGLVAAVVFIANPVLAQLDYSASLGADFRANVGGVVGGQPTSNPFGANLEWTFLPPAGKSLASVPGGIPASGQAGWCQSDDGTSCNGDPTWSYFSTPWQPGVTIEPGLTGHGPQELLWTAPANINEGGVAISGSIEQLFETARRMRLSVFKNGNATAAFTVDALPPFVNGVLLQRVNFGPLDVFVGAGDTLLFRMDGSGEGGNGVPTFVAWDLSLREAVVVPEPTTIALLLTGLAVVWAVNRAR
ncbi:MAG: PEP-CTERM sorting domain-containing protein [Pirellulales bacterium]